MVHHGDAFNAVRRIVLRARGLAGPATVTERTPLTPVLNQRSSRVRMSPLHSQAGPPSLYSSEARGLVAVLCDTCLKRLVLDL